MKKDNDWKKELRDLPAINYNLYIGAGTDACDNCLEFDKAFDKAVKQIEDFICQLLIKEKDKAYDELQKRHKQAKCKTAEESYKAGVMEITNIIKMRLKYCQLQNGLPYCKNCGLCLEDLEIIRKNND